MFTKKFILTAKLETTYKSDASPGNTDAVEAFDVDFKFNRIVNERNVGSVNLGTLPSYISTRDVTVSFKTYIKTNGSAGGMFGKLLQACAFSETEDSGTYTYSFSTDPINAKSLTLYFYQDGLLTKVLGARGTFDFSFKAGEFAVASWNFQGLYVAPSVSSIITPDFESGNPFIVENSDFKLGGIARNYIETFTVKQEGLESFMDINGDQGFGRTFLVDALFTGTIDPEVTPSDVVEWETSINNSTTYTLNYTLGSGTGNVIALSAPAVQIVGGSIADKRGIEIYNLDLNFRTTESGSSPITITIS